MSLNKNNFYETNSYLRHITDKSPEELNGILVPNYNVNMFRESPDNYVFATNWKAYSKGLYFLKSKGFYAFSIDTNNTLVIIKRYQNFLDSFNSDKYMYFISHDGFESVRDSSLRETGEFVSRSNVQLIDNGFIKMDIDSCLTDDEFGNGIKLYVCEDENVYRNIREIIDSLSYENKINCLEELKGDYIYKNKVRMIKR